MRWLAGERVSVWSERIRAQLNAVVDDGRWRSPREFDARGPAGVLGGDEVVSFASNDYLGLSVHPAVVEAAADALARWGAGSGASRLVTGSRPVHSALERALAEWKGTAAAVCFPTGFAANLGALSVLGGPDVRVLSDELNHASIIDGCRLSRSRLEVYRHGDVGQLEELLRGGGGGTAAAPTLVVTDSVFSMDGDVAPLDSIMALCRRWGALLLIDEAHAVLGPHVVPPVGDDEDLVLVRVGTLSKTLGSLGGFVAGSQAVVDLLVNRARSYIFSTALTPADAAAALAAVGVLRSAEGAVLVARLSALVERLVSAGLASVGHPSPILPVIMGSEQRALEASASLLADGLWVPAIRPPTVPVGTSRLRVTLSAAHSDEDVSRLIGAVSELVGLAAPAPAPGPGPATASIR
jgi:8-amino-7-oxononanoate synthase